MSTPFVFKKPDSGVKKVTFKLESNITYLLPSSHRAYVLENTYKCDASLRQRRNRKRVDYVGGGDLQAHPARTNAGQTD